MSDELVNIYKDKGITQIVGIESRGFVMSSAVAYHLNAGVVLCRKPGKLPCETIQESYAKEYGMDTRHRDNQSSKILTVQGHAPHPTKKETNPHGQFEPWGFSFTRSSNVPHTAYLRQNKLLQVHFRETYKNMSSR